MLNFIATLFFIGWLLLIVWIVIRLFYIPKPSTFSLYFGSPGCGKTTFLTRLAYKRCKRFYTFVNFPVKKMPCPVYKFDKSVFDSEQFPEGSLILFDEGSLNGYDNRNFKKNFSDGSLEYFKQLRHYRNQIVFSNQGWDELDRKIRILTNDLWYVRKIGPFSLARRVKQFTTVDETTQQIIDGYEFIGGLRFLLDPRYCQIIYRPSWYKYFDSYVHPVRPDIDMVEW